MTEHERTAPPAQSVQSDGSESQVAPAPKVSVIVPSYNHAAFLAARLDSIFNQTYSDYEVMLFDDCSTDGSAEILRKYEQHPRLSALVINERNGGPFSQWKKAIAQARGEYIWIAESDDLAEPSFLTQLTRLLDADRAVGVAYCQSNVIDGGGVVLYDNRRWTDDLDPELWRRPFLMPGTEALRRFFVFKNVIPNASAALFRKALFDRVSHEFTSFRYTGDWLVWAQILRTSDLSFLPEPLNRFRLHDGVTRLRSQPQQRAKYLAELYAVVDHVVDYSGLEGEGRDQVYDCLARRIFSELGAKNLFTLDGLSLVGRLASSDRKLPKRLFEISVKGIARRVGL